MRIISIVLMVFSCTITQANPVMLNSLLNNIDADPSVRAAHARLDAALSDQALQKSETGAQLFVGASAGKYNELVTNSIIDDHYARAFVLGVRYPLLGTLKRQLDALQSTEFTSQRQQLEISIRRAERRLALRTAYADWWKTQQEQQWCKPMRAAAAKALHQLQSRQQAGWLLASDAAINRNSWDRTLSLCSIQNSSEAQARAMLELLAQQPLRPGATASETPLMANPAPLSEWRDALEKHPRIAARHTSVTEAGQNRTQPWYASIDSNISVGYSVEDRSGTSRNGRGLVASLNFTMPFNISGHTSARRTASSARYRAAQEQLIAERRNLIVELSRILQLHQQSRQNLLNKTSQFAAAKQHLNDMQARTVLEDDNAMLQIQSAQRDYYQAGLDRISAWHQVWLNNAAVRVFAEDDSNPEP
ncbi:MAG TPA: TolC family protein, partial [Eoetvoesiella sp.]